MQVVVLLAGVVDPKWRIDALALRPGTEAAEEAGLPRRLSPFDEAALECALKLRDADPAVRITVAVPGEAAVDSLLRAVAAFRPQRTFRLEPEDNAPWDPYDRAALLGAAIDAAGTADLVLTGREFGDADDGVLPALLAELRSLPFCGQAHAVSVELGGLIAQRVRGPREEVLRLPLPALVSITNDRGNRLRHPLMKNVMIAKREAVEVVRAPAPDSDRALRARTLALAPPPRRGETACRILAGPPEAQLDEFVSYLRNWRDRAAP